MAQPARTTKQIAERFTGNLDYSRKPHYWRRWRFLTAVVVVFLAIAGVLAFHWYGPDSFFNSGPISSKHAHIMQKEGVRAVEGKGTLGQHDPEKRGCQACHNSRGATFITVRNFAVTDASCLECHRGYQFHVPNVPRDHACKSCHTEHKGKGPMPPPTQANCVSCHGDAALMGEAATLGRTLPREAFDFRPDKGLSTFLAPRPERGYTQVFHSFATNHPEFQVNTPWLKDSNSLKFGHKRHLDVQRVQDRDGKQLQCVSCHKTDASGEYNQRITYDANCRECHALQFDENNPKLHLPHGNPDAVRAFLHSLDSQYADHGRKRGIIEKDRLETFVAEQLLNLQKQDATGDALEARVFFSDRRNAPAVGALGRPGPAKFGGCAYCHEVKPAANAAVPVITKPMMPDRWLVRGAFHHEKHGDNVVKGGCVTCHKADGSDLTSDILMPKKNVCVQCHQPGGSARHDCAECHSYHTVRK